MRANQGKPVQVTILRDKKQETLTLQVDSKHLHGELENLFPEGNGSLMAALDPDFAEQLGWEAEAAAEAMREQARALQDQLGTMHFEMSPQQAEQLRQQAEKLRNSFKGQSFQDFKIDQKQLDQLKQQMEEFRKSFKPEDFKPDPKQMDELRQQMDQLKRQMKEMRAQGFGHLV